MQAFFSAIRFLTIFPVPLNWCGDERQFNRSPDWYPLVGLCIGLLMAAADLFLRQLLPLPVVSVLLAVALIAVSGALHIDGLADTADAFFSARDRQRMLDIMKDSCAGPMGVTAIVVVVLLKVVLILSLPLQWRWQTLILIPLAGRSVMPMISSRLPYVRQEQGTGAFVENGAGTKRLLMATAWKALGSIVLLGLSAGLSVWLAFSLCGWWFERHCHKKIGGYTGDTLGAACELLELVPPLCVVALAHLGAL